MFNYIKKELNDFKNIARTYVIMNALTAVGYGYLALRYESYIKEEVEKGIQSNESIMNTVRCFGMTDEKLKTNK